MRFGIIAWGSTGDIEPMVMLSKELVKHGHKVELVVFSVQNKDYSFLTKTLEITVSQKFFDFDQLYEEGTNVEFWNPSRNEEIDLGTKRYLYIQEDLVKHAYRLAESSDAVIGTRHIIPLACFAKAKNVPYISVSIEPSIIRSKYFPPLGSPDEGEANNAILWDKLEQDLHQGLEEYVNGYMRALGLEESKNIVEDVLNSKFLNLITYSKHLFNAPPDWEGRHYLCGYFNPYMKPDEYEVPPDLLNFIQKDSKKTVFITFGSMIEYENDLLHFHKILLDTGALVNGKVIIQSKWDAIDHIHNNVYKLSGFVSYPKILDKVSLVVHHGGTGTSHFITASGCPSIIMEYGFDQGYNAQILHNQEVLAGYLKRTELTAQKLAEMINQALEWNDLKRKAEALGSLLKKENGIEKAINLIEEKLKDI